MSATPVGDWIAKRYPPNDGATHAMGDERNWLGCMAWHNPCLYDAAFREGAASERERIRQMATDLDATVPQSRVNGVVLTTVPFADLLDAAADELPEPGQELQGDDL